MGNWGLLPPSKSRFPGSPIPVRFSDGVSFAPVEVEGSGAFGDLITSALDPKVQVDFVYGGHDDMVEEYTSGSGAITYATSLAEISCGASLGGKAMLHSKDSVRYRPGQGSLFRFDCVFGAPVVGVEQLAGAFGGTKNGLFFGYDATDSSKRFGIARQHGGVRHVHALTMTAGASGAETFTITLNGNAFPVSLTAGTTADNAQEIAEESFAGWQVEAHGSVVYFLADASEPRNGSYSASGTGTATGTMALRTSGVTDVETWTYQESWNVDKMDGTGPSKSTLNPQAGNAYQIRMQYAFGDIEFGVEDPSTGDFIVVHKLKYAGSSTEVSSTNPTYEIGGSVESVTTASTVTLHLASLSGFVEGGHHISGPDHGQAVSGSASVATPVLSIRNNEIYSDGVSLVNLRKVFPTLLAVSGSTTNKPIIISAVLDGVLTDPLWDTFDTTSLVSVDQSATGISGGINLFHVTVAPNDDIIQNLRDIDLVLEPGEILSLVIQPTGTAVDYAASIAWKEDT